LQAITGDKAVYKFMPTCAYEIGDITVDKKAASPARTTKSSTA
jgi:hypothetical protein